MLELRPYQIDAVKAILKEWDKGHRRTLLVLPTGTGKTACLASVAQHQVEQGHKVLILAHRGELLEQARDKLKKFTGLDSALEKSTDTAVGSDLPVVVGSVQTLSQEQRLNAYPVDYFQDIIIDEAHHCLSDTYQRVLEHFPNANILGVTATPDRGDQKNLGSFFQSKAYEYDIASAIRNGYLVPIMSKMIPLELDISHVSMSGGDFAVGEVGSVLDPYLERIAQEMVQYCKGHHTVVFLPLIETSQKFVEILNNTGLSAAEVNGSSKDRAEIIARFERGEIEVLCNAMLLTEGWDCPSVDRVVVLRPTKIRSLYSQAIGRGTRLYPGKDHLLILDFLWLTDRHDLCRPSALIAKDEILAYHIDRHMQEGMDLTAAAEVSETEAVADREFILARELEEMRKKHAKMVDPIQYAYSVYNNDLVNYVPTFEWETEDATAEQIKSLEQRGINPTGMTRGRADAFLKEVFKRENEGYASPKQIRFLERMGFKNVAQWDHNVARKMTKRIIACNWKIPKGVNPAEYHGMTPAEVAECEDDKDIWKKMF